LARTLSPQEIAPPAATAAVDADGNPIDSEAAAAAAANGSSSGPSQVMKCTQQPKTYFSLPNTQKNSGLQHQQTFIYAFCH
jgi:hypothetical protein